jgi:hypothetical protein
LEGKQLGLYAGDAMELGCAVPDDSVDLIWTDPVYDAIEQYRWLATWAERVLVEGGSVVAQVGTMHRYEAEVAMRESGLIPLPLLAEIFNPVTSTPLMVHKLHSNLRPFLWFSKGKRGGGWINAANYGSGRDKRFHKWGDSAGFIAEKLQRLAPVDGIVADPFSGGGTVGAVCKTTGAGSWALRSWRKRPTRRGSGSRPRRCRFSV